MKLRWTKQAFFDIQDAHQFIAEDNLEATRYARVTIESAAMALVKYPEMGRPGRIVGIRELVVPRTPYILAYRITEQEIHTLAVIHGNRKWPDRF